MKQVNKICNNTCWCFGIIDRRMSQKIWAAQPSNQKSQTLLPSTLLKPPKTFAIQLFVFKQYNRNKDFCTKCDRWPCSPQSPHLTVARVPFELPFWPLLAELWLPRWPPRPDVLGGGMLLLLPRNKFKTIVKNPDIFRKIKKKKNERMLSEIFFWTHGHHSNKLRIIFPRGLDNHSPEKEGERT